MNVLLYLAVAVAAFLTDFVWAEYIRATATGRAIKSALLSGVIVVVGAFVTLAYVEDSWSVLAAVVGGTLGTYCSVKRS